MKFNSKLLFASILSLSSSIRADDVEFSETTIKMCLFYPEPSGHARSDPILNQECPSDHVHTFYGPQNFHPDTTNEELRNTSPTYSTAPWIENQSLYWHPSIYEVREENGQKNYTRVTFLETSPYYRWDRFSGPETVAFPPNFRMIASTSQEGADGDGTLIECCDIVDGEEDCTETPAHPFVFPNKNCDFLGIAFAMPTCWDESKGDGSNDPYDHVTFTTNGDVSGPCPDGYGKKIPQIQLFVRIHNYRGGEEGVRYQFSDESNSFHVDFMNGWAEGALENVLDQCQPSGYGGYNPPCDCTQFLTPNTSPSGRVCDAEVEQYILNEKTDVVTQLPRGTCQQTQLITKSWEVDPPFDPTACKSVIGDNEEEEEDPNEDEEEEDEENDEDENEDEEEEEDPNEDEEEEDEEEEDPNDEDEDENEDEEEEEDPNEDEEEEDEEEDPNDEDEDENEDEDEEEDPNDEDEDENEDEDDEENPNEDEEEEEEEEDPNEEEEEDDEENPNEEDEDENEDEEEEENCKDDKTFKFRDTNKGCNWVAKKPNKHCEKMSNGSKVYESCPMACGRCGGDDNDNDNDTCEDDTNFRFKNKPKKSCVWIGKKLKTKPGLCNKGSVKKGCPKTCNLCDIIV